MIDSYRKLTVKDLDLVINMNKDFRVGFVCDHSAERFLLNPMNWIFACIRENRIIGFAYGYEVNRLDNQGNMVYIHEVAVLEEYQHQGIGYRLLCSLKEGCREKDICRLFLITSQDNIAANALYKKAGGKVSYDSMGKDVCYIFSTQTA